MIYACVRFGMKSLRLIMFCVPTHTHTHTRTANDLFFYRSKLNQLLRIVLSILYAPYLRQLCAVCHMACTMPFFPTTDSVKVDFLPLFCHYYKVCSRAKTFLFLQNLTCFRFHNFICGLQKRNFNSYKIFIYNFLMIKHKNGLYEI